MEPKSRPPDSIVQGASAAALAVGVFYLTWRLLTTLNPAALWLAIPVWTAEAYGVVSLALFFFTVWRPATRSPRPAPGGLSVDIVIPTRDEPIWMVRRAALGALAVRYAHGTYLLDDGHRPEIAYLARELGCGYLAEAHVHGKGENLNNALWHSHAEFIAVFDADHVPAPDFLDRTLGYFADERVAFVQTAQDFYNVDSYQHRFDVESRRTWHDQTLLFRVLQPGRDAWGAALFTGSCAVFRRRALDDVGGFATETVAEDLHTSIRLHGRRWRSVYHNEILAYGLAPVTAGPYHAQRLRWGRGAMQVFRLANPLTLPGLSLPQRLCYLATLSAYFDGFQKLVFYVTPALYLLTGILPVAALDQAFVVRLLATYAALLLAYKLAARGHGMALLNEHYNMVRFYTYIKSTFALLFRQFADVAAPPAPVDRRPWRVLLPVLLVFALNDVGVYAGTLRFVTGRDPNPYGYVGNIFWATWHIWLAIWAVWFGLKKVERRALYRVPVAVPVRYATEEGDTGIGVLVDVHEEGAGLLVPQGPFDAHRVWIQFLWFDDRVGLDGEVVYQKETANGLHVGLRLRGLHPETRDFLATFVILFAQRKFMREVGRPMDPLGAQSWPRERRHSARRRWHLPVRVEVDGAEVWGVTQDVSARGALVLFPRPLPEGLTFQLAAWTSRVAHDATVVHAEEIDLPPYTLYRAGLSITPAPLPDVQRPRRGRRPDRVPV